jgi:hypothetical protein
MNVGRLLLLTGPVLVLLLLREPAARGEGRHGLEIDPAEAAAYQAARPVFVQHCLECHDGRRGKAEAARHLRMDSYPFEGHHAATAGAAIRDPLGLDGGTPTMPKGDPGSVPSDQLELVAAWADAFDAAHGHAPASEPAGTAHGGHQTGHEPDSHGGMHAAMAYAVPRETLIPGRPGMPGFHFMINGFFQLQNPGVPAHDITNAGITFEGGKAHPLVTGDWAMGYWRQDSGWLELLVMLDFEPFTVGKGGYPQLGQSGEGLVDAQHAHQLVHQAMVAFHPLAGLELHAFDLAIFAGQGSATIGPPIFMHRASSPGPTVARKHHKGENPHETFPVIGMSLRVHDLWLEGSFFSARELDPDDSRYHPHAAAPVSAAARVRYQLDDRGELQVSASRLRDQGEGIHDAWQTSASAYIFAELAGWRLDALLDHAADVPDDEPASHGALLELAARDPDLRSTYWSRTELNQREVDGESRPTWFFQTLGAERVVASSAASGLQAGFFAEATVIRIPDELRATYGQDTAVTIIVGVHVFGMWMLDSDLRRRAHRE